MRDVSNSMLRILQERYRNAVAPPQPAQPTVVERVHELFTKANEELKRYIAGTLPLYVEQKGRIRHVTMTTIEEDMMAACSAGKNTIEYGVHTHLYPGFRGDNVSLLTGKYYLVNSSNTWTEVSGAPSYIDALRQRMEGLDITFVRKNDTGVLRITLPLDFMQPMKPPTLR